MGLDLAVEGECKVDEEVSGVHGDCLLGGGEFVAVDNDSDVAADSLVDSALRYCDVGEAVAPCSSFEAELERVV